MRLALAMIIDQLLLLSRLRLVAALAVSQNTCERLQRQLASNDSYLTTVGLAPILLTETQKPIGYHLLSKH